MYDDDNLEYIFSFFSIDDFFWCFMVINSRVKFSLELGVSVLGLFFILW